MDINEGSWIISRDNATSTGYRFEDEIALHQHSLHVHSLQYIEWYGKFVMS